MPGKLRWVLVPPSGPMDKCSCDLQQDMLITIILIPITAKAEAMLPLSGMAGVLSQLSVWQLARAQACPGHEEPS